MYERKISRQNPGLILFILDDSTSMQDALPGTSDPKYCWNERLLGNILKELLARSTEVKGEGVVIKPRYYVYVIIYGSKPQVWGNGEMSIEEVVQKYTERGNSLCLGGKLGGTDTKAAFELAHDYLSTAVTSEHFKDAFPPIVFHLSDGESQTDASPVSEKIKGLSTSDGGSIILNAYIGTETSLKYEGPEDFSGYLEVNEAGPGEDNIRLFNMSSVLPPSMIQNLVSDGIFPNLRAGSVAFFDVRTREMLKHAIQVVGSVGSRADR